MTDIALTPIEEFLLRWLSKQEFSQYGECFGKTFDRLIERGLVQIHEPAPHRTKEMEYREVSLTEAGRSARAALKAQAS